MKKKNYLSNVVAICLLFSLCDALTICNNNKCKNGAQCLPDDNEGYSCQCINGYRGKYCEDKYNLCDPNPCKHGATCMKSDNGYRCQCLNGWEGKNCQSNVDDCALKPCKNGGVCKDLENHKYQCECPSSYIGMLCEHKDPCADPNPCGENGKCVSDNSGGFKCHCNKGYTGLNCSTDVDECVQYSSGLCENGGKCINTKGSYRCECANGYSGERCTNDIIDCKNGTCKNGGTCLDKIGRYKCVCTANFRGTNCEIPISMCESMPCKNSGQCRDYENDYSCICPEPWTGKSCESRLDPCSKGTCVNGGVCSTEDGESIKCMCQSGFNGKLCENNIDECLNVRCQNGGVCEDLINSWRCKCPDGFRGRHCEININECSSRPCRNNGLCVDLINDYKCDCPSGLMGKNCEINIDECASHPCINGARCEDRVGGYTCHCLPGFVGLQCELKSDVCRQLSPCKQGGICRNDPVSHGGYNCTCPPGINTKDCSLETSNCVKVTCNNGGRCLSNGSSERCFCTPGYHGSRCEIEMNECRNNPCQHGGSCQDLVNDYLCHCPNGFKGKNCETNINECVNNPCGQNGICIDEINGFRCKCYMPYYGPSCSSKYDPCKSNACANDAICVPDKDYKSYHCNCSTAFGRFAGRYCDEDINECLLNHTDLISHQLVKREPLTQFRGPCLNMGFCINTKGSFICKCANGFEGRQCEINTDDCRDDPCKNNGKCADLISGYKCHCQAGFSGENCEIEINECEPNPCQNGATCNDHINDYQCLCNVGFSGKNCQVNDNDCTEQSCSGNGNCVDKVNDFECECYKGFKGKNCEHTERPCDSNRCLNNGSCVNRITKTNEPGYLCNCRSGFTGPSCEIRIDLCRRSPCGDHGTCHADKEGLKCSCHEGYIGDRCEIMKNETCQTFSQKRFGNQSLTSQICDHNAFCLDQYGIGGFKCSCPSGYGGTFCQINIDDCASQPCLNGGECIDGIGMYYCKCPEGFQGVNCQENRNDCKLEPCHRGKCVDQINNFTCICPKGTSGRFCDIVKDNCKDVKCHNGGLCQSLPGDFNCQCKKGFSGKFCEVDINECRYALNNVLLNPKDKPYGPCSPSGSVACVDGPGEFKCICRKGYSGNYCEKKIDACQTMKNQGRVTCFNAGVCVNQYNKTDQTKPSYRCNCPSGYGGDRCQLHNKKCQYNLCQNGGICRPVDVGDKMSFECQCPPGVGGLFCEKDYVNECDTTICYHGGQCLDGFGKATCRCSPGFCGERCEVNDAKTCNVSLAKVPLSYEDELSQCQYHYCSTKVNNKICDLECNNLACGFDGGECLHKVPKSVGGKTVTLAYPWSNCTVIQTKNIPCHHWFMNGICDPQCNTEACLFDGWDCEKTINKCPNNEYCDSRFGDRQCNWECNTIECDYDGGDCVESQNTTILGAIVLVLPVPTTVFVNVWQSKLLQSLTHLLHSIVRVKKLDDGASMIYPIRVFVENVKDETMTRHKRTATAVDSQGKPGTKVYLEVDNSACKHLNNMCFDSSKAAAEFVSAALHSRLYRPPIPILSVQADSGTPSFIPLNPPIRNMLIYVILVMSCLIVLGVLVGVLYGFIQNKSKSDHPKTEKADTWFPEGMKRLNQSSFPYHHRRLNNSNRKRNQNTLNGFNLNSELGNLPQMTKSKLSTTDSIDDSGSNSLTSTRVTSYDANANENNNDTNNTSENCTLLSNGDINCNFPPEKRLKLHMDSNASLNVQPNLESWCFNAFVHLLLSGNGLGELTSGDTRDKQMIMEKLFHIANSQANHENQNMFTDVPNKKEVTNNSLKIILAARLPHSGETLLHLAAKFNRKEAVRFLLEAGGDPNKEESNGRSCLLTAIDSGALEVTNYLLEQQSFPIDIHQKGPGGVTCLIQAVKGAHLEIIQIILQHTQPEECDLNVTDNYGRTALHWASATNQIAVVQLLLSYGLNKDAQDNEEMTPLYLCTREGFFDMCKLLLANGANPDMSDHLDRLPRDIAKANHFEDIVALFDDYVNLSKENQQNRPMLWGQYSYYSNNYYCHRPSLDLKSVLYSSPHSLNQMACCVFPNGMPNEHERSPFYNTPLTTVTHSSHPLYRGISESSKKRVPLNSTSELTNPDLKYHRDLKSPFKYKDNGNYFDYYVAPYINANSNVKNCVLNHSTMLQSGGYPSNNPTSSTSAPGITPSPDSDSPGHWSTSSPSLSPRSKNQQNLLTKHFPQQKPTAHQMKSSVLHYHPANEILDPGHSMHGLQTSELCGFQSRNDLCQY